MKHEGTKHADGEQLDDRQLKRFGKKKLMWLKVGAILLLLALFTTLILILVSNDSHRSEKYKNAKGAAGLAAVISYTCAEQPCNPSYNFNVYVLDNAGQQVGVVRPDKDGRVNLALAEGEYVLLIGKQYGKNKLFPQEKVSLKNGKSLELKLDYKE